MGQVVKAKGGNVVNNSHLGIANRQALIMIRGAGELGFTHRPRLIGELNPFDVFR